MEMCVYSSRGVIYPFAGIPNYWENISFDGIRTEGAFLIGGIKENGEIKQLTIFSEHKANLKIALPSGYFIIQKGGQNDIFTGDQIYTCTAAAGEKILFERSPPPVK